MRRRMEGALGMLTVLTVAQLLHAGGLVVTVLLAVATVGASALLVGLGWCWGHDDRIRTRRTAPGRGRN